MSEKISNAAHNPGCLHGKPVEEEIVYIPAESTLWVTNKPPMPIKIPLVFNISAFPPLNWQLPFGMALVFFSCQKILSWTTILQSREIDRFSLIAAGAFAGFLLLAGVVQDLRGNFRLVLSRDGFIDTRTMTGQAAWSDVAKARSSVSRSGDQGILVTLTDTRIIRKKSLLDETTLANQIFVRLSGSPTDMYVATNVFFKKIEEAKT